MSTDACVGPSMHAGKLHWRNTKEQLALVGPSSLGVSLLTAAFVGMVFTIQARCEPPSALHRACQCPPQSVSCTNARLVCRNMRSPP